MLKSALLTPLLLTMLGAAQSGEHGPPNLLPDHFTSRHYDEDDPEYRSPGAQNGLYAHGYAGALSDTELDGLLCKGDEAQQRRLLESIPGGSQSEFWFYATETQGVLFTRRAEIAADKPCATALSFDADIERAFVADGIVHSLSVDQEGRLDPIGSRPLTSGDGEYSGSFNRIHNLMARPGRSGERSHGIEYIAGARTHCSGLSGLVWSSVCAATRGPARGMILRAQAGDDTQVLFHSEIDDLRTGIELDGRLFELERTWELED
jgi:hypothetical protein